MEIIWRLKEVKIEVYHYPITWPKIGRQLDNFVFGVKAEFTQLKPTVLEVL